MSAPVETTVKAEKLFEAIPLRKQHVLKESRKAIVEIKYLMEAYALAKPYFKFFLKMTGDPGQNRSYVPALPPSVRNAALQIFGKSLAAQCIAISGKSHHEPSFRAIQRPTAMSTSEALTPDPTCDSGVIKGKGTFIFIDSRPITSIRGTAKNIVFVIKSELTQALQSKGHAEAVDNPLYAAQHLIVSEQL